MGWFGKKDSGPSIQSLTFDTTGWKHHTDKSNSDIQVWETPETDAVTLNFFAKPPDLPIVQRLDRLREFYMNMMKSTPARLVDLTAERFAGHPSVLLLVKAPMKPHGFMYQAALTLPFRDFSFVVRTQCFEQEPTGIREAILTDQRLKAGEKPNVIGGPIFKDWNPDSSVHDKDFPKHPVSRARRLMKHIIGSASLDRSVSNLPAFEIIRVKQ